MTQLFEAAVGLALLGSGIYLIADVFHHPGHYLEVYEAFSGPTRPAFTFGAFLFLVGGALLFSAGMGLAAGSRHQEARPRPALNPEDWLPPRSLFTQVKIVASTLGSMFIGIIIWFGKAMIED